jgi:hypothetical protein
MRMMREEQVETLDLNFSLGYVPGRAYLGLLRIAYLTMFKRFGLSLHFITGGWRCNNLPEFKELDA